MNRKLIYLSLVTFLAGTAAPAVALAERDHERDRDRQQQSRSEHREDRGFKHKAPQRVEQRRSQHVEPRRSHRAEQRQLHRVEPRRAQQHVERVPPRRVERQERREHKPVVSQHRRSEQHARTRPAQRRHVETHRSFHIERPSHVRQHRYYRVPRQRYYHGIHVHRRYGHLYPGFGFYYSDNDALQWIAFTVLTLAIIDHLDEHQQRMHEQAQIRATTANIGDTIYWRDRYSHGSVTVTDIWYERGGRECRELEQSVTSRGRTESSFNTVCQDRNGRWEVASLR